MKANIVFSPSSLDLFLLCHARYNYGHNMRLALPPSLKSESLDSGTLIHIGQERYFKLLSEGKHFNDRVNESLLAVRAFAAETNNSNLEDEQLNFIVSTLEQNFDYWRHEDENLEVLEVETPFDFILYEDEFIRILISGKIDLLVNDHNPGRVNYERLPYDHKSFKRDFMVPRLSNQFITYVVATKSSYLIVNRIGLQKTVPIEQRFKRLPMSYDPLYLESWKKNTIQIIINHYLTCVKEDFWPMNNTSCFKYNRQCEFYDVCDASGDEAKKFKLESNYIVRELFDKYKEGE